MKTTKIAASFLSLSLIVPGLIVSFSVRTKAQTNKLFCPEDYFGYTMKSGDTLFKLAGAATGNAKNWTQISKPGLQPGLRPTSYTETEASNLAEGDPVCIPNRWRS